MSIFRRPSRLVLALALAGFSSSSVAQHALLGTDEATQRAWQEAVSSTRQLKQSPDSVASGTPPRASQPRSAQHGMPTTGQQPDQPVLVQMLQRMAKTAVPVPPTASPAASSTAGAGVSQDERSVPVLSSVLGLPDEYTANLKLDWLFPHETIRHAGAQVSALPHAAWVDLDAIVVSQQDGRDKTIRDWRKDTATDGLLVMHRGQVVYEHYSTMLPWQRHATWSVSKSLVGVIATDLIQAGMLDGNAPVAHYLPELRDSAWADATVQQTLDMTTGVDYEEAITVGRPGVVQYMVAAGLMKAPEGYSGSTDLVEFLKSLKKSGEHGKAFHYKSVDTEVIGLLLERKTGKRLDQLVSAHLWQPIGAGMNAFVVKNGAGQPMAGMGFGSTLRDLARFGETLRQEGRYNGRQILQPGTVAELRKGGSPEALARGGPASQRWQGYTYHDFWWVDHENGNTFEAKGFSGQHVHVNPEAELVVVKLSSYGPPDPFATHRQDRAAFAAIAKALKAR